MLRDAPTSLDAYKQPSARPLNTNTPDTTPSFMQSAFNALKLTNTPSSSVALYTVPEVPFYKTPPETDSFALGRVLVWLMVIQ